MTITKPPPINSYIGDYITAIRHVQGDDGMDGYNVFTSSQLIHLRIDNDQRCCEYWGYMWSNDNFDEYIGARIESITLTDTALNVEKLTDANVAPKHCMFVTFDTDRGRLQFVLYNAHNGYYGHTVRVTSRQLNHTSVI